LEYTKNNFIIKIFLYIILPTYLLAGGYNLFTFKYLFPLYYLIIILIISNKFIDTKYIKIYPLFDKRNIFFLFLLLYSFINVLRAPNYWSIYEFLNIFVGLNIILLMEYFLDQKKLLKLDKLIKIVILILSINFFVNWFIYGVYDTPYLNRNALTTFLVFVSPILFAELIKKKNLIINVSFLISIYYIIDLCGSRFNMLAYLIQLFLTIFFIIKNSHINNKNLVVLFLIFILLFTTPFILYQTSKDYRGNLIKQYQDKTSSLRERIHFINEGFKIFINSALLGVSSGNIEVSRYSYSDVKTINNLHNFVIDLLAKYGIFSFALFLYLFIILLKDAFINENPFKSNTTFEIYILILFLFSFPISSNTISTVFTFRPFYFMFGYLIISIINKNKSKKGVSR